jgi:tRNA-splicing ligase RtcB (3'-phosphate/5'-hydroxy nucleic acid ligase)
MPLGDKVIPNVIGVDLGCGMAMIKFNKTNLDLKDLDAKIRNIIPMGMKVHNKNIVNFEKDFPWNSATKMVSKFTDKFNEKFGMHCHKPEYNYNWFKEKCKQINCNQSRVEASVGTLGGGNHFIELGESDSNMAITIHSGSRNFGKCVCDYWQNNATKIKEYNQNILFNEQLYYIKRENAPKDLEEKIKELKSKLNMDIKVNKELDYLEGSAAFGYLVDMIFAQQYADFNRASMIVQIKIILENLGLVNDDNYKSVIETIHNYIDFEDMIIRKGAIASYEGKEMIIPFNMRDGLIIAEGKSNKEWNYSAAHGAGRILARGKAKRELSLDEFKDQMKNIYSTSVCQSTLDEAPNAYKDSQIIEKALEPTMKVLKRYKPILNIKAL